jgi:hypothetical protein
VIINGDKKGRELGSFFIITQKFVGNSRKSCQDTLSAEEFQETETVSCATGKLTKRLY